MGFFFPLTFLYNVAYSTGILSYGGPFPSHLHLHQTAVGITESRWTSAPNAPSASWILFWVVERRLLRTFGNATILLVALIYLGFCPGHVLV